MHKLFRAAAFSGVLLASFAAEAQRPPIGERAQQRPTVERAIEVPERIVANLLPPPADSVVCIPYSASPRAPVFRCKSRANIHRDVTRLISRDWANRFEKDYRSVSRVLGIDPEGGSFAVCPQGGAFSKVDLTTGGLQQQARSRRNVRAIGGASDVFEVFGSAARQMDAGCATAGGGIGPRGEFTGRHGRGGQITYDDFIAAGGAINTSQWTTLTGNAEAMFAGMTCAPGDTMGLASDGGSGSSTLSDIWDAIVSAISGSEQSDRAQTAAETGVETTDAEVTTALDGTVATRTVDPDTGDVTVFTSWKIPGDDTVGKETETTLFGDGSVVKGVTTYLAPGKVNYVRKTWNTEGSLTEVFYRWQDGQKTTEKTLAADDNGKLKAQSRSTRGGSQARDPDIDRSCSAQQDWLDGFVAMCGAINWQSGPCFQAVLLANQCVDPRNMTPTPDGPALICQNAGKGAKLDSREDACRKRSMIALSYPDSDMLTGCSLPSVGPPSSALSPRPEVINPAREGVGDLPPAGASPRCDPRDPRCGPAPQPRD